MSDSSTLSTKEDFELDLEIYDEFFPDDIHTNDNNYSRDIKIPKSIQRFRDQIAAMPKNQVPEIDEKCTYIALGRGMNLRNRLIEPGKPVPGNPIDDLNIQKTIRKVVGLGYSNQIIESAIKNDNPRSNISNNNKMEDLKNDDGFIMNDEKDFPLLPKTSSTR